MSRIKTKPRTFTVTKPSKHDVLAQVWHFLHYVEHLAATPKGLRHNIDTSVIKKKCEQVKAILRATD